MRLMQDLKSLLLENDMQFILSKNIQNTKKTLQVPSGADASARATVISCFIAFNVTSKMRSI